jgi:hypothetical protein
MAEETVLIRFKSDDEVSKTTKAVNDGLDDVGKNATKAGSSFSGMGSVMTGVLQGVGQGLIGMASQLGGKAISAVTDFIGGAISEAAEFDSVMAQTQAVIASTGSAAGLKGQLRRGRGGLLAPHFRSVVWTAAFWCKLTLPHHDAATEVTHFLAVLIETLGLNKNCSTVIL